jgi:monomeric sarcosine oxidase
MGSAAAYHLAKDGRAPLLLEQFAIGHTLGSSHGGSRITRYANPNADDVRVVPATYELWRTLEAESGATLLKLTGGLFFGPPTEPFMVDTMAALDTYGHDYQRLDAAALAATFPQFQPPAGWVGFYQADSGILAASRCVEAMARQAVAYGATLREQCKVISVAPAADGVLIELADGETIVAGQVIITVGPWAPQFLRELVPWPVPLQVTRQQVAYFPVADPARWAADHCPIYIFSAEPHIYGFPIWEKPGHIKVALEMLDSTTNPDDPRLVDQANAAALSAIIERHFHGVDPQPAQIDTCLYTETANRDFVIDRHPDHPQIILAAGFSGRGFKFTIGVGRLLADLAASAPGTYSSHFWSPKYAIGRFAG